MDTSDKSFTYYPVGKWCNRHGVGVNALPVRRKIGVQLTDPRIQGGKPFDQVIVEFWYEGKWVKLSKKNAYALYGAKPKS